MLMNGNTAEIRSKNVSPKVFLCRISRANIYAKEEEWIKRTAKGAGNMENLR